MKTSAPFLALALPLLALAATVAFAEAPAPPPAPLELVPGPPPHLEELDRVSAIRKLLELTGVSRLGKETKARALASLKQKIPDGSAAFWTEIDKDNDPQELLDQLVVIYLDHLSPEDVHAAVAFYETPAGQHWLATQGTILKDSANLAGAWERKVVERGLRKATEQRMKAKPTR